MPSVRSGWVGAAGQFRSAFYRTWSAIRRGQELPIKPPRTPRRRLPAAEQPKMTRLSQARLQGQLRSGLREVMAHRHSGQTRRAKTGVVTDDIVEARASEGHALRVTGLMSCTRAPLRGRRALRALPSSSPLSIRVWVKPRRRGAEERRRYSRRTARTARLLSVYRIARGRWEGSREDVPADEELSDPTISNR